MKLLEWFLALKFMITSFLQLRQDLEQEVALAWKSCSIEGERAQTHRETNSTASRGKQWCRWSVNLAVIRPLCIRECRRWAQSQRFRIHIGSIAYCLVTLGKSLW